MNLFLGHLSNYSQFSQNLLLHTTGEQPTITKINILDLSIHLLIEERATLRTHKYTLEHKHFDRQEPLHRGKPRGISV